LVAGAWVGGEDRQLRFRSLRLGQGANTALPIYGRFMQGLYQESKYSAWKNDRFPPIPASVLNAMDCSMYEERDPNFLPNNLPQLWEQIREQWDERREERQEKREERRRNPWSEPEPKRNQLRLPWQRKKSDRSKRMFDDS
jgi:penicillin-binding protein 1A